MSSAVAGANRAVLGCPAARTHEQASPGPDGGGAGRRTGVSVTRAGRNRRRTGVSVWPDPGGAARRTSVSRSRPRRTRGANGRLRGGPIRSKPSAGGGALITAATRGLGALGVLGVLGVRQSSALAPRRRPALAALPAREQQRSLHGQRKRAGWDLCRVPHGTPPRQRRDAPPRVGLRRDAPAFAATHGLRRDAWAFAV